MNRFIALALLLIPSLLFSASQTIPAFRGLHNSESSMLINDDEAQAIQDVDITDSGLGLKKRDGYTLYKAIGVSTAGVRGGYYFRTSGGNDLIIHANNMSVLKSAAGGNYSAFITTDTLGSYYDFTDSQGYLWRANSSRDEIARYDGTTLTYYPSHPKGDQVEALPDRLVISGTSGNPNRINFSASADFTTFTTGLLETDGYTEDISLPGQKVNAIKVGCGSDVLAWTRDTLSQYNGTSQYNGVITQVSNTIGTVQPNSVIQDYGITYWQGQDKHFYAYDCNTVIKLSEALDVSNFAGGETKQWEQTEEDDWEAGTLTYTSSALSAGDVVLSTWTRTDSMAADFNAGTLSNTSVISDRVYLSTNNTNVLNNSFEDGTTIDADNWTEGSSSQRNTSSPKSGSYAVEFIDSWVGSGGSTPDVVAVILDVNGVGLSTSSAYDVNGSYGQYTIPLSSYAGRYIKVKIVSDSLDNKWSVTSDVFLCSGNSMTFWAKHDQGFLPISTFVDLFEGGRSTTYSGTFTSQAFNTSLGVAAWLSSNVTSTANSHSITWQTQSSSDGSSWASAASWTPGSAPTSAGNSYIRYIATISTGGTTNGTALPYIEDATLAARASSGTFVSQTKNIGSNATAFRNFSASDDVDGGTIGYFIRTATTEGGLAGASYTVLTKDTQISASINPWIQVKATFTITAGTQDPTLSNFIIAWDEGTIVRTFGTVDNDHRLMWSIAEGTNTVPNTTYIYDPRFSSWLRYAVPFDAPAKVGSSIYFGNPSSGSVYNWPSGASDNGSAITAYWKSKDFIGGDPFVEKDYTTYSLIAKQDIGSNVDVTYTINSLTSVTNNHTLTDPSSVPFRRLNARFPSGKFGTLINFQFGNDDLNAPFELYGFRYDYTPRPWRVMQ